jgi:hypothetical protein
MPSHAAVLAALAATPLVLSSCQTTDSCVAAGTRVATPRGWVPVEQLRTGDAVLAVDVAARVLVATTITEVRRSRRECLGLTCGDRTLIVTPDHPIFAPARDGFVDAGRIALGQVGDVLLVDVPTAEATPRVAAIGPCNPYAGLHDVYDLSVAGDHRTFVAEGFVVHNKSYQPQTTTTATTTDPEPTTTGTTGTTTGTTAGTTAGTTDASTGTTVDTGSGPFGCGPDLVCEISEQYCERGSGGDGPNISYQCLAIPAECAATPDCACLVELLGAQGCSGDPATGVTVEFAFP